MCLELTLAGRRLRVRRSPEWQRPKRRGVGWTRQPASAVLEERQGDTWVGLSTRIDEVSQLLLDWIGMNHDQFFQVVLLPQGEFARFLRADSLEREALLERLFGTQRFTGVQDWLADRRGNAKLALEKAESELHIWLHRLCQELGIERSEVPSAVEATATWRAERVRLAEESTAAAERAVRTGAELMVTTRAAAEDARTRRRLQERRILAERELAAVTAGHEEYQRVQERVALARRGAVMPPLLAALEGAQRKVQVGTADVQRWLRTVTLLLPGLDVGAGTDGAAEGVDVGDSAALVRLEQRLRAEGVRLADLRERAEERAALVHEQAGIEATLVELDANVERAACQHQQLPALIAAAGRRESAAAAAAAALPGLGAAAGQLAHSLEAARAAVRTAVSLAARQDQLSVAVDRHQAATGTVQDLRERRLAGMAAELAGALVGGQPCPVCGSAEHPVPADRDAQAVTEAAEASAVAAQRRAAEDRAVLEETVQLTRTDLAEQRGRSGGRSIADLTADVARLTGELAVAQAAETELTARTAEVAALRREQESLGALLAEAMTNAAALRGRAAELHLATERISRLLAAACRRDPSLAARMDRLAAAADDIAELLAALQSDAAARTALTSAVASAETHAAAAGFPSLIEAAAAVGTPTQVAQWQESVSAWERREAAVRQLLAEPGLDDAAVIAAAHLPEIDLAPTTAAQVAAEAGHTAAVGALTDLRRRAAEIRRLTERLAEAEQATAPARTEYADVRALADLVAGLGQNIRHMTLRAYVLAARLAEVAESASRRLQQMSGGRYTFAHTDVADSRRIRAGLGLVVVDDYSGLARSPKTLSGGESFLASLALALGLADVVTAETAGVQLETLFIDEGFGSLDADTLDQVMSTLDELRTGGRVVGVVSHLEEMRARIPSRLLVRKRRDGSTLEQVCA